MKLLDHKKNHIFLHKPDIEMIESTWNFRMERSDFTQEKTFKKYEWVKVDQKKKINPPKNINNWHCLTWFKGTHSNSFSIETKDKEKQQVIQMISDYLLANDNQIVIPFQDPRNEKYPLI